MPLAATAVDASNVKVLDEDAYLSRNMTIEANNKCLKELIWINSVICEIVFQPLHPDTWHPLHESVDCSARGSEFAPRVLPARYHPWNAVTLGFLFSWCQRVSQEAVKRAQKIKNTVQLVVRGEPNLRLEFYQRDVTDGLRAL